MNKKTVFAVAAVALLVLLAGCGGSTGGAENATVNESGAEGADSGSEMTTEGENASESDDGGAAVEANASANASAALVA
ncbi:hypothetical protein ACFO0N_16810 [Halobium salinum]|uniref:Uncharacterized protein n=1 Tax=Halobium salinum TaxID=1364940 RepID=A0ABD5PFB8_9EURY|nr:hypothetical protein [Halobium salinum]